MNQDDIKAPYLYKRPNKKCNKCGITSITVNHSKKYNLSLCIECLKEIILEDDQ